MSKDAKPARPKRADTIHISMPRYIGADVRRIMAKRDIKPSEFFRSMYDQAKAAKLPIISEN